MVVRLKHRSACRGPWRRLAVQDGRKGPHRLGPAASQAPSRASPVAAPRGAGGPWGAWSLPRLPAASASHGAGCYCGVAADLGKATEYPHQMLKWRARRAKKLAPLSLWPAYPQQLRIWY